MIGRILCAGLLSAALCLIPQATPDHFNNLEVANNAQPTVNTKQPPSNPSEHLVDSVKPQETDIQLAKQAKSEVAGDAPDSPKAQAKAAGSETQVTGCEAYRHLVSQYDWNQNIAMAIMRAESGCNPSATNTANTDGSTDRGLFQVNSIHRAKVTSLNDLYDPATNIRVAYSVYRGSGWKAWSVYNSGKYQRYLE